MTTLYLVRHAEAFGNHKRIFHGVTDSDITDNGKKQLNYLAERFKDIHLDAIYSSDLLRTKKTAEAVNRFKKINIVYYSSLREINGGDWEEKLWAEIEAEYAADYFSWCNTPHILKLPNGDDFEQFSNSRNGTINEIVANNINKSICIVTHGTVIRTVENKIINNNLQDIIKVNWADNTAVTKIVYDENFTPEIVWLHNASHLPKSLQTVRNQGWSDTDD